MRYNPEVIKRKHQYLDTTPLHHLQDFVASLIEKPFEIREIPRPWQPGGGSQNFLATSNTQSCFIKSKHKSLYVESALESEASFSDIPALQNEYEFLIKLAPSPHVPRVLGFIEKDDYLFLATEPLQPFSTISDFTPPQIVHAFNELQLFVTQLYSQGIVHTDIHEKNICFRGTTPVVIDFEEARYLRQEADFSKSLDVAGDNGSDRVGEFPLTEPGAIPGFTCLERLKKVFKKILKEKLPAYLAKCNFDSTGFNLDSEQQPDDRIYQSIILEDLVISGQRPVDDQRLPLISAVIDCAFSSLNHPVSVVDLGSNMGMVSAFCAKKVQTKSVVGLEADARYVEAANVLAFYQNFADVSFQEFLAGSTPYKWEADILLMLSVYHHIPDKDAFLKALATKKPEYILGEFAVQPRYYQERGNLENEISHIQRTLGYKYVEILDTSKDYQRPVILFHNSSGLLLEQINNLKSPNFEILQDRKAVASAISWLHTHSPNNAGVAVSSKDPTPYPEVSGYLIPTLLKRGEEQLARQYASWLASIQNPDGSFPGPGMKTPFAFDTGQVVRGFAAILPIMPEVAKPLGKACEWLVATATSDGRLALPGDMSAWSLGNRGYVNEAIHLYVLPGLLAAGKALNTSRYDDFVSRSLNYYIKNCNLTNFRAPNMLLHFYCYIQEALFDLGAYDECQKGMRRLAARQKPDGFVPAYDKAEWICTPGLIQAALTWLKLGDRSRAMPSLKLASSLQTATGGFPGSVGEGANYFKDAELAWPIKFWFDALELAGDALPESQGSQAENISDEPKLPIIELEIEAISSLVSANSTAPGEMARDIPTLLDWGRRKNALETASRLFVQLDEIMQSPGWQKMASDCFLLGGLLCAIRQPEISRFASAESLQKIALAVLQKQKMSGETPGLFACFAEFAEAGYALGKQEWQDCASAWAARQKPGQCNFGPERAADFLGAGKLLGQNAVLGLLRECIFAAKNNPNQTLALLRLAEAAWIIGDDDLAQDAFASALAGQAIAAMQQTDMARAFLAALTAKQRCGFALSYPHYHDNIAPDDGRFTFVARHIPGNGHALVLDMGTGKGRYLRRLHHLRAARMVGQDVHNIFARFMPKGVDTGVGTVLRSGWNDSTFDAVMLCEVLEHCIDLPAAIVEMHRILKDGGRLIIIDKNIDKLASWPGGIPAWEQWFDTTELLELLRQQGFIWKALDTDLPYEGRQDGLFFGIMVEKHGSFSDGIKPVKTKPIHRDGVHIEGNKMLSESEYGRLLDSWINGIGSEIDFWNDYMKFKGLGGAQKWEEVISDERPFRLDEDLELPETFMLDVGSGPFSRCGMKTAKTKLHLTIVDALAPAYIRLKKEYDITTGITPIFGFAEMLEDIFPGNSFDIVHMSNSLDHSINPVIGIYNLFHVCKINGKVILRHTKNEASRNNFTGLHQWNLCVENGRFIVSNRVLRYDVQELLGDAATIETYEDILENPERKWKYDKVVIRKHKELGIPYSPFRKICFAKLAEIFFDITFERLNNPQNGSGEFEKLVQENSKLLHRLETYKKRYAEISNKYSELVHGESDGAEVEKKKVANSQASCLSATDAVARSHKAVWEALKSEYPNMPLVDGVELTNSCNLSCPNCPTPTTKYPKGFASEQTVMLAIRYATPNERFSFHRLGEPFLHKDFLKYLRIARESGLKTVVSTNGILLSQDKIEELIDCKPDSVMVSLHTKKSLEAFANLATYCLRHNSLPPHFCANVLSHNKESVWKWVDELQLDDKVRSFLRDVHSHSWAGNVAKRKTIYDDAHRAKLIKRCYYIRENRINVRWDGTVVACCLDSENSTQLGHIQNLPLIAHKPNGYALCQCCDEDWMHR